LDEITASLQKLIDLGRSLGATDDPIIPFRVAEAQDHLLQTQKEQVKKLQEQARYKQLYPRFA